MNCSRSVGRRGHEEADVARPRGRSRREETGRSDCTNVRATVCGTEMARLDPRVRRIRPRHVFGELGQRQGGIKKAWKRPS